MLAAGVAGLRPVLHVVFGTIMVFSLLRCLHRPSRSPGRVRLEDIAESSVLLESCPARAACFAPADARRADVANPFLDWVSTPIGLTAHVLRDVVYDVDSRVLIKDGNLVEETCYLQPSEVLAALRVDRARLVRHAGPGVAVPCSDHWPGNYYHWMTHALPVMAALSDRPEIRRWGRPCWLLPDLLPWQRQTLDLLCADGGGRQALTAGRQYRLDRVVYCNIVAGAADFALSRLCQSVFPRMAERVPVTRRRGLRLYVDRGGAGNRAIPNEAALAAALAAEGFCVVRPERMTVSEQIDLFRAAAMVVGPLGAGMTNIGFCRPGTLIYELVPDHHANPCFLAMAMRGHLNYWADQYPTGATTRDHVARWGAGIDVARVLRQVSGLWSRGTRPVLVSDGAA